MIVRNIKHKLQTRPAFTLAELLVVALIISIIAGLIIPVYHGRIDSAKWSEANTTAGVIRSAVSTFVALHSITEAQDILTGKSLGETSIRSKLGFTQADLTGRYFVPSDYTIAAITDVGHAVIKVIGSQYNAPAGQRILTADGLWQ